MKPSREKTYRANSLSRELRKIGGSTLEETDGWHQFVYTWFHQNTICIYEYVTNTGHDIVFIGCNEKHYEVAVHKVSYGSLQDAYRYRFTEIAGFALLMKLVKLEILSSKFTPALDPQYSKLLHS